MSRRYDRDGIPVMAPERWIRGPVPRFGYGPVLVSWPDWLLRHRRLLKPGRPVGRCLACGLPCWTEHRGAPFHPCCPDPRTGETR